jgi:hypothetical protein
VIQLHLLVLGPQDPGPSPPPGAAMLEALKQLEDIADDQVLGDGRRLVARGLHLLRQGNDTLGQRGSSRHRHPVLVRAQPSEHRSVGWQGPGCRGISALVEQPLRRQGVHGRRRAFDGTVDRHRTGAQGVDDDEQNRGASIRRCARRPETDDEAEESSSNPTPHGPSTRSSLHSPLPHIQRLPQRPADGESADELALRQHRKRPYTQKPVAKLCTSPG